MTKRCQHPFAVAPPKGSPAIVALLRSQPLISAARKNLQLQQSKITLTKSLAETQARLAQDQTCVLLIELDDPADKEPKSLPKSLHWLRQQHAKKKGLQSVALSARSDAETVVGALCAGASGYLVNDPEVSATDQWGHLLRGLRQLSSGKAPVSAAVMPHLVEAVRATQSQSTADVHSKPVSNTPSTPLSKRETEVLGLAAKGFSYAEMAQLLGLSVHTISTHTRRIYTKLEVNSRSSAIYEATRQGLLLERSAA